MNGLLKLLGSVRFTVFISVVLIVLLITSTSMEAINGTPFAQKVFYNTRWFDLVVSLLWVNIFCSTLLRFPFKKGQFGFLVTHIGILLLLGGALVARAHSMDGELAIYEGETGDSVRQDGHELAVAYPNQETSNFDFKKGVYQFSLTKARLNAAEPFCPLKPNAAKPASLDPKTEGVYSFNIVDILQHASEQMQVIQGKPADPVNHAVQVKIQSKQMSQGDSFWLIENLPGNTSSSDVMAGPVKLSLRQHIKEKTAQSQKPVLKVLSKDGKELLVIDVEAKDLAKKIPLAKTGLVIKDLVYYPYATVAQKGIINYPEGKKLNPAVVYNLVDAKGVAARQVKFAYFPDFESMHPSKDAKAPEVKITFEAGEPAEGMDFFDGLQVAYYYGDKDVWQYQVKHQDKLLKEGEVTIGNCLPTGWMDVEFCTQELFSRARVSYAIAAATEMKGPMAVAVTLPEVSGTEVYWAFEDKPVPVHLPKGDVYFMLAPKMLKLPFTVALKQFRKIDYPGTMDAAGYESDVVLTDPKKGVTMERTISMNHPLEYDGYKIFQSSYMSDPKAGKGSVFTVAKNPGIPWIYAGSIIACLGAILLFYWTKKEEA